MLSKKPLVELSINVFKKKNKNISLFAMSHMPVKSFCSRTVMPMLWKYKCWKNVSMLPWGKKKKIYVAYMTYLFLFYKSKPSEICIFAVKRGENLFYCTINYIIYKISMPCNPLFQCFKVINPLPWVSYHMFWAM